MGGTDNKAKNNTSTNTLPTSAEAKPTVFRASRKQVMFTYLRYKVHTEISTDHKLLFIYMTNIPVDLL